VLLVPAVLLVAGCAYFNTFYNAQTYYREGVQLSAQKQVGQARTKFEKSIEKSALVLSRWPRSRWADDATFLIGRSYLEMGQYGRAIRHFDQLALAFPNSELVPRARYYRGLAMLRNREYGPARVVLDQVRREYPRLRDDAAYNLAVSFHDREDWARAVDSLTAFLERFPKSPNRLDALRALAASCERLGRWEDCEYWYRRLADLTGSPKERAAARLEMAGAMVARGRHEQALPVLLELIGRYPDLNDEAYVLLGRVLAETGRAGEAVQAWRNVRGSSDFGAEAYFRIGKFHEEQRDFTLARAHYDTARSRRANSDFGVLAVKRLTLLEAIARSDSTGEREPAEARFLVAEVMNLNLGEYDEARRLYQQVADSFPGTDWAPKALLARAWITRHVDDDSVGSVRELEAIIAGYPLTEYANEAKRWLGLPAPPRIKPVVATDTVVLSPVPPPPEPELPTGLPGEDLPPGLVRGERDEGVRPLEAPVVPSPPGPARGETAGEPARERPRQEAEKPAEYRPEPAVTSDSAFAPVYFDYDQARVRDSYDQPLRGAAAWLREYPDRRLRLTGHCDPRGTPEYNLALGLRRAQAVHDHLVRSGIESIRMTVVTRGKEDAVSSGPGDYWRDRRVEFELE
jgi:peptidoglycan-associated lipoprotein